MIAGPPAPEEEARDFAVVLEQEDGYRFVADFGLPGVAPLVIDEPAPLSEGAGPNAARLLAAGVGHCLSASLLFCLNRAHVPVRRIHTSVTGTVRREERGRLRVGGLQVDLDLDIAEEDRARAARCLGLFEDFCIVTASVRRGVDIDVAVSIAGEPTDLAQPAS